MELKRIIEIAIPLGAVALLAFMFLRPKIADITGLKVEKV